MRSGRAYALYLLSRREYSTVELRKKLKRRGYPREESEQALADCKRLGYLDDLRWAQAVVRREVRKGRGPRLIRKLLSSNDIDPKQIEELLCSLDQTAQIASLLEGRLHGLDRKKAWATLLRRGFEPQVVASLLTESEHSV